MVPEKVALACRVPACGGGEPRVSTSSTKSSWGHWQGQGTRGSVGGGAAPERRAGVEGSGLGSRSWGHGGGPRTPGAAPAGSSPPGLCAGFSCWEAGGDSGASSSGQPLPSLGPALDGDSEATAAGSSGLGVTLPSSSGLGGRSRPSLGQPLPGAVPATPGAGSRPPLPWFSALGASSRREQGSAPSPVGRWAQRWGRLLGTSWLLVSFPPEVGSGGPRASLGGSGGSENSEAGLGGPGASLGRSRFSVARCRDFWISAAGSRESGVAKVGSRVSGGSSAGLGASGVTKVGSRGASGVAKVGSGVSGGSGLRASGVTKVGSVVSGVSSAGLGESGVTKVGSGVSGVSSVGLGASGVAKVGSAVSGASAAGSGRSGVPETGPEGPASIATGEAQGVLALAAGSGPPCWVWSEAGGSGSPARPMPFSGAGFSPEVSPPSCWTGAVTGSALGAQPASVCRGRCVAAGTGPWAEVRSSCSSKHTWPAPAFRLCGVSGWPAPPCAVHGPGPEAAPAPSCQG